MKKTLLLFFISILVWSFNAQIKIPTNSTENTRVSNWIVAKVSNFDEEGIKNILNNTKEFYEKVPSDNIKDCLNAFSANGPRTIDRTAGATG